MNVVDLNADVGEGDDPLVPLDAALIPWITSANIACGVHAGNAEVMRATVALAVRHSVTVGAHPSLDDRAHFGRRELTVSNDELKHLIRGQVTALDRIARTHGTRVRHVKPHGALYNMAARTPAIAAVIADTLVELNPALTLVGLSGSELIKAGRAAGLTTMSEVFADRAYLADGSLAPRGLNGAVLSDARAIAERAVAMVEQQQVEAIDGTPVRLTVETICLHSDTPGAVDIARRVREALAAAGVHVSARR